MATSLAAAVQPPQPPPTVHVERVELANGLRVAGDDASDSVRKKRARRHEFEKWERVKGMGSVNIVEGEHQIQVVYKWCQCETSRQPCASQLFNLGCHSRPLPVLLGQLQQTVASGTMRNAAQFIRMVRGR